MKTNLSHPQLKDKLNYLYAASLNPEINNHSELARALGVSRQAVGKWIAGTETSHGNKIPGSKIQSLSELFGISPTWLALPIDEFRSHLSVMVENTRNSLTTNSDRALTNTSTMPLTERKLFGREKELTILSNALENDKVNVLQIIGFGGIGKSSLINSWLNLIGTGNSEQMARVFAWSFDWQGSALDERSSADYFIESALEWFGAKSTTNSSWAKATKLAELVRSQHTVLVLDGIETLLTTPDIAGSKLKDHALDLLIKELSNSINGLCVISSRTQLATLSNSINAKSEILELQPLPIEASVSFFKAKGLTGLNEEFESLANQASGHPLSLNLLAGYLLVALSGDLHKLKNPQSLFGKATSDVVPARVMDKYFSWFENRPELQILNMLALVGHSIELSRLETLVAKLKDSSFIDKLSAFENSDWHVTLAVLEKSGLVTLEEGNSEIKIGCHLIVSNYFSKILIEQHHDEWVKGNSALFDILQETKLSSPTSILELETYFRIILHGCRSQRYADSFQFYFETVKQGQAAISPHGSHQIDLDCLRPFFKKPWTEPLTELPVEARFFLISSAAINLIHLGNIDEAMPPVRLAIDGLIRNQEWERAANAIAPLVSSYIYSGKAAESKELIELSQECINKLDNPLMDAALNLYRGYLAYLRGDLIVSQEILESAYSIYLLKEAPVPPTIPVLSSFYTLGLIEKIDVELGLKRAEQALEWREQKTWQSTVDSNVLFAFDNSVVGYGYLKTGQLDLAITYLNKAVDVFTEANTWFYLPHGLDFRSKYYRAIADYDSAIQDLTRAASIANRTGAKLIEWNVYISLTWVYLDLGDINKAREAFNRTSSLLDTAVYRYRDDELNELRQKLK